MAAKRPGLGRGISALIPTAPATKENGEAAFDIFFTKQGQAPSASGTANSSGQGLLEVPGARLVYLSPNAIIPNAVQPRSVFDPEALAELVASIREVGVLQPIVVRPIPGNSEQFELIMGERRLRASKEVGLESIPVIIKDTADENMLRDALLENLHRAELNPLEEASAYQQLLADFNITQEQLAERIGRSRPQITNTIRLLKLPAEVQKKVAAGVLSAGHARAILALPDEASMTKLAHKIINEDLSVRAAEAIAQTSGGSKPGKPKVSAGTRTAHLNEIASRLGDRLDTRVSINLGNKKGLISIEFATVGDLNRILEELGENPFGG
jgi:ParB family chromosome partitioning protein